MLGKMLQDGFARDQIPLICIRSCMRGYADPRMLSKEDNVKIAFSLMKLGKKPFDQIRRMEQLEAGRKVKLVV